MCRKNQKKLQILSGKRILTDSRGAPSKAMITGRSENEQIHERHSAPSPLPPHSRPAACGLNQAERNAVIGECALRAGSYALAEKAFRNMMKSRSDAFPVNQLAAALKKQGGGCGGGGALPAGGRPLR